MDKKTNIIINTETNNLSKVFFDTWERLVFLFYQTQKEFDKSYLKQIIKKNLNNIKDIWDSFTVDRSNLKSFKFNTPEYSLAYFIGFHIVNASRVYQILTRILSRFNLNFSSKNIKSINIFDIGCGTGAMSSSLLDFILSKFVSNLNSDLDLNINLMDKSSFFIKQAHTFNDTLYKNYLLKYNNLEEKICFNIKDYKTSIENLGSSKILQSLDSDSINIFLVGYLYNEIFSKKKAGSIFHSLFQKKYIKESKDLVIILDPANKTPCRNLMEFKDFMVKESSYTPIYPCPMLKTTCPMLKTKDWCYSEFNFKKDSIQNFIDNSLNINRAHLSVSALCFISDTLLNYITPKSSTLHPIVVGKPIIKADKTQKHIQYLLCNGQSLSKKYPTDKNETTFLKGEEYKK